MIMCVGRKGSMKTVNPTKYHQSGKTASSARTVLTSFHALHVPLWFCSDDDCLVITFMTSTALNPLEKAKISRMFTKLYHTRQYIVAFIFNFVII